MHRRTRRTLLVVAAVLVFLAVAVFLRSKAPPEAARLLPESDGILYINFRPVRAFLHKDMKPPERVPDYQQFVNATGIDPEHDLDQAAIALHRMANPNGPNGPVAYSLVLVGKVDGNRLKTWLAAHAASEERYAGRTIYSIPSDGRTVRVAQIGYDMVAVSNTPTPEQIHSIIDRRRTAALPFAGSTLLAHHFHEVPLLALAWGVGQIGLPFSESGAIEVFGFRLPLEDGTTLIASVTPMLRLTGELRLRVEEIAPSEQTAQSQAAALNVLLNMARGFTAPLGANPANDALKQVLATTEVDQRKERVVVTARLQSEKVAQIAEDENAQGQVTSGNQDASK
ncbi:MAG: hypothetical protein KGJ51_07515 [Acidobacteriota bacterium]|nr:hypothetical protein [Acidobacteriota bacterium]MDE3161984.1 hypothetical protein [Acidobacteriota bacterium]